MCIRDSHVERAGAADRVRQETGVLLQVDHDLKVAGRRLEPAQVLDGLQEHRLAAVNALEARHSRADISDDTDTVA